MRRRDLIADLTGVAATWPRRGRSGGACAPCRRFAGMTLVQPIITALRERLAMLGWVERRNTRR